MKVIQLKDAVSVIRNTLAEGGLADTLELRMGIKAKEFIEPKWIPVTERLPEEGARVIVTQIFGERTTVYCTIFPFEKTKEKYITAWMPLPEPYKESEDKE